MERHLRNENFKQEAIYIVKRLRCEFNIDTGCVEAKFSNGSQISVDCAAVENEVADNLYERSELDWLVYNAPVDYLNLILTGDIRAYLKGVTEYRPFEN